MSILQIMQGDALEKLRELPSESVHCCVTSPPYFGLRDYGAAGQIGVEGTPDEYVAALVAVFREVRRVLRKDATLWLNLGDSYAGSGCGWGGGSLSEASNHHAKVHGADNPRQSKDQTPPAGMKAKDLMGIPWMVAFALRNEGWYLRSDIIWHKPNPMPESVTDRPTKSHEYIFLLSKSASYYYDAAAIAEPSLWAGDPRAGYGRLHYRGKREGQDGTGQENFVSITQDRNKRSVWTVNTKPYSGVHFATFPPELIKPCILAGCPIDGAVLDPFAGSGTVGEVARRFGRNAILIELNPDYIPLIQERCADPAPLFGELTA